MADTIAMDSDASLSNHFLIAMPKLADPYFFHTVTYLATHDDSGARGLVINRPSEMTLADLFKHLDITSTRQDILEQPVYTGGPVQVEQGFILHNPDKDWQGTLSTQCSLSLTASKDILEAIAIGEGPKEFLVALGYAGWGAGQLEQEMLENSWLTGPADDNIIFHTPIDERWNRAAQLVGIDLSLLSTDMGHA
ncbi:MAG: YqgE/AlgH family protein [Gammaproteobacteria bacterium]|nr:YqgE/AlgH family protein [Gammaproteobacteria bacterium]